MNAVPFFALRGRQTTHSTYAGIPEFAIPGLHDRLFETFSASIPKYGRVIDLASGGGAWAKRLQDHGYAVTGCDIAPENCAVECLKVDLNKPFARDLPKAVDAVTCIEMLEHIENPRHILREAFKLLRPGGLLLLSTPNASGLHSRVKFLATGRFAQFDDLQYEGIGHIRPITHWELDKMLSEAGFGKRSVEFHSNSSGLPRTLGEVVKSAASLLLGPLVRGMAGGQVLIMSATKPQTCERLPSSHLSPNH